MNDLKRKKDIYDFLEIRLLKNFTKKYTISTLLIIENPVRSPNVPPIADNMSTNFAVVSLVITSNAGMSM